jgi:hypothetical protein
VKKKTLLSWLGKFFSWLGKFFTGE